MAKRRMVSKDIVQTQRFLRLPLEAQALYFHLMLSADDDGIVEAFPVVRMIGASEDSLGLLVVKRFIKALNDEMVYFIIDFLEQNKIRKDRYTPSVHKDLLDNGNQVADSGLPNGNQVADSGLPNGNQMADNACHSIGKDSIGKDSIGKDSIDYMQLQERDKSIQQALEFYQNNFGILSSHIQEDLIYWCQDCSLDLVVEAMKRALANQKPYSYAQGILKSWLRKNIRTLEQVQAETIQHKQQQRNGNQQPVYHVEDYRKELYGE